MGEHLSGAFADGANVSVSAGLDPLSYEVWLHARDAHRRRLFGDDTQEAAGGHEQSLAELTRLTAPTARNGWEMLRARIQYSVSTILAVHDQLAVSDHNNQAIFGLVHPDEYQDVITDLTCGVVYWWERAWHTAYGNESDNTSPFADLPMTEVSSSDFEDETVQLVVETAAAVCEVIQSGYGVQTAQNTYGKRLVAFIARHGPDYAASWIRGDVIRSYCQERNLDAGTYLELFTRSARVSLAVSYHDHLDGMERIAHQYHTTLSTENLQQLTGLEEEKVVKLFPPSVRIAAARAHVGGDVSAVIRQAMVRLYADLEPQRLAERYGWSAARAAAVFSEDFRLKLALGAQKNVWPTLDRVAKNADSKALQPAALAKLLGWSKEEVNWLFTPAVMNLLCRKKNPKEDVVRIATNYDIVLATDNLAGRLNMSEEEVNAMFPEYIRRRLSRRIDPIWFARRMRDNVRTITSECGISQPVAAYIVLTHSENSVEAARAFAARASEAPPGVSMNGWVWAMAMNPRGDARKWAQRIDAHWLWIYTQRPAPLEGKWQHEDGSSIIDLVADKSAPDPADVVAGTGQEALESLCELAEQAGVSHEQLEELLCRFSDMSAADAEQDATLAGMLEKLRQAAG